MKPFRVVGLTKKDRPPINKLLQAAKLHDSPYIVYKHTRLYVEEMPALLETLDGFDLIVIPRHMYVPN